MRRLKAGAINLSNQNPQSHVPNRHKGEQEARPSLGAFKLPILFLPK